MKRTVLLSLFAMFLSVSCSAYKDDNKTQLSNKEKAIALLESLPTKNTSMVENYVSDKQYIQHNPNAEDGKDFFIGFVNQGFVKEAKVIRAIQDENYVVAHMKYDFFGPKAAFDILRFENGQVVEHWDNLTPVTKENPSGHTQFDGSKEIKDLDKTIENKEFVKQFVKDILVDGDMTKLTSYFDGDNYIQHNSLISDQLSGLGKALATWAEQGIFMKYNKIHMVLGEGNFVLTVSEGTLAGEAKAFYDLFRVENGKIAEHWDVIETMPAEGTSKNTNGKF